MLGDIAGVLEGSGFSRDQIDRIRIRDRSTFVKVRAEIVEGAVEALNGAELGGREVTAELAKSSRY